MLRKTLIWKRVFEGPNQSLISSVIPSKFLLKEVSKQCAPVARTGKLSWVIQSFEIIYLYVINQNMFKLSENSFEGEYIEKDDSDIDRKSLLKIQLLKQFYLKNETFFS